MSPEAGDQAKFDEMIRDYLQAFNSGDYKRVASYWTEDAVHLPPMGGEVRGRAALEEFYRQYRRLYQKSVSLRGGVALLEKFPLRQWPMVFGKALQWYGTLSRVHRDYAMSGDGASLPSCMGKE